MQRGREGLTKRKRVGASRDVASKEVGGTKRERKGGQMLLKETGGEGKKAKQRQSVFITDLCACV
eukprot:1744229-Rhodomonas_salina.1